MKLSKIMEEWTTDSFIDKTKLIDESVKSAQLHSKYYRIFVEEKLRLAKAVEERKTLLHLKHEYYSGNLDFETLKENGWPQFQTKILKSEIDRYIDADKDMIKLNLELALLKEKVTMLKDVIYSINQRTFVIKNINDSNKFLAGEY